MAPDAFTLDMSASHERPRDSRCVDAATASDREKNSSLRGLEHQYATKWPRRYFGVKMIEFPSVCGVRTGASSIVSSRL